MSVFTKKVFKYGRGCGRSVGKKNQKNDVAIVFKCVNGGCRSAIINRQ